MRKAEPTGDVLFDRFWGAYPRKVSKDKALIAFRKIKVTEELLNRMLDALQKQSAVYGWQKPEKYKYIPHPTTWLNQRRWEEFSNAGNSEPDTEYSGCCTVIR